MEIVILSKDFKVRNLFKPSRLLVEWVAPIHRDSAKIAFEL